MDVLGLDRILAREGGGGDDWSGGLRTDDVDLLATTGVTCSAHWVGLQPSMKCQG